MSIADEYRRQFAWRDWDTPLEALPDLRGKTVLDLGCGVGDLSAELAARGARVIGLDANAELLAEARSRSLANAAFVQCDLAALPELDVVADGLWCSFTAAYFPDLSAALGAWARHLRPGGWAAFTEIDDLFAHEPLEPCTREAFEGYAREALEAGRYDFRMGRKLGAHLQRAGLRVSRVQRLADQEFAFSGAARADVLEAWRDRFRRMPRLRDHCGPDFERMEQDFLACLARPDHRSLAKVYCCIALK